MCVTGSYAFSEQEQAELHCEVKVEGGEEAREEEEG